MSKNKTVNSCLHQLGFKNSDLDPDYETDFIIANNSTRGILLKQHSDRFSNLQSLIKFLKKNQNLVINSKKGEDTEIILPVSLQSKFFTKFYVYIENEMNHLYFSK